MPSPTRWRRIIGHVLPWFDAEEYEAERKATKAVLEVADRVITRDELMRAAYRQYADRVKR